MGAKEKNEIDRVLRSTIQDLFVMLKKFLAQIIAHQKKSCTSWGEETFYVSENYPPLPPPSNEMVCP